MLNDKIEKLIARMDNFYQFKDLIYKHGSGPVYRTEDVLNGMLLIMELLEYSEDATPGDVIDLLQKNNIVQ